MGLSDAQLGFILVCAAGSATGVGAAVVFSERLVQLASKQFLAGALAVSAGVMLYVSFAEIFVKSQMAFEATSSLGPGDAYFAATASFFGGMLFMSALDSLVHMLDPAHDAEHSSDAGQFVADLVKQEHQHLAARCCSIDEDVWDRIEERRGRVSRGLPPAAEKEVTSDVDGGPVEEAAAEAGDVGLEQRTGGPEAPDGAVVRPGGAAAGMSGGKQDKATGEPSQSSLERMGLLTALAIGLHNFPEGLATFVGTLNDPAVGVALAVAIAIHNIPEGLCVSIPIYFATGDRMKAFKWAIVSGISEPIGAGLGWLLLKDHFNQMIYGVVFGMVAGMMVAICLHELIPTAHRYDPQDKYVTKAIIAGMLAMAASLCLFVYH